MKILLALTFFIISPLSHAKFEYIIKLKSSLNKYQRDMLQSFGPTSDIKVSHGKFLKLNAHKKLSTSELNQITAQEQIYYIEPNQIYNIQIVQDKKTPILPMDWYYDQQWGLKNTGTNSGGMFSPGKEGEDINAEAAWEVETGSSEIIIAVIDTGVDYGHSDLKDNIWVNDIELNGEEGVDDDENGYIDDIYGYDFSMNDSDPMDGHGHGTHCAGVIGAKHNSIGVKGTMDNVKLMSVKFLSDSGSGTIEGAIKAIDYAVNNGAHILSNSWGGGGFSQALYDSIKNAQEKGILFVAAAGNARNDNDQWPEYPASYDIDNIVSVGAMTGAGTKARFSNFGQETVHVFAPGNAIMSTYKNNNYRRLSGTSMATPFVSGIAGLALSQNNDLNYLEIKQKIIDTSVKSRSLSSYTVGGRAEAYEMLNQ